MINTGPPPKFHDARDILSPRKIRVRASITKHLELLRLLLGAYRIKAVQFFPRGHWVSVNPHEPKDELAVEAWRLEVATLGERLR